MNIHDQGACVDVRGIDSGSGLLQPLVSVMKIGIQLDMVDQTDGEAEANFADMGRICNPPVVENQTHMDAHKALIYRHPLFPLLVLLLEKCEQSTQSSDCLKVADFDFDIANFVGSLEKDDKPIFSEDPELDHLMVKAIQVLRIHLLELEKVNDLCKDFCTRYIACLKDKINNETLLSEESDDTCSHLQAQTSSSFSETMNSEGFECISDMQHCNISVTAVGQPHGTTVYQSVTPEGHVMNQAISPSSMHIHISQNDLQLNQGFSFYSTYDSSSKNKRSVLPKQATNIMRSWLFQHITHPYPSEDEKKQIAVQTNLTLLQVNNWFINARRRILPVLDTSFSETAKTKKKMAQKSPLQRFWPDSVASNVSQEQHGMEGVGMSIDGFHALSSDSATLAMQQVMMGNHSEEETDDSGDEDYRNQASIDITQLGLGVGS